jgi:hypothetical protein
VPSVRRSLILGSLGLGVAGCGGPAPAPEGLGQSQSALDANDQTAFDYFLGKGLTNFQAAGIIGNLDQGSSKGGPGEGSRSGPSAAGGTPTRGTTRPGTPARRARTSGL